MGTSVVDSVEGPLNIEQGDPLAIDFKALATARLNICRLGDLRVGRFASLGYALVVSA